MVRVEQVGEIFDVPVTVTLLYSDRKPIDVLVAVTDRVAEVHLPLAGVLRGVDVNKDDCTLAEIVRN